MPVGRLFHQSHSLSSSILHIFSMDGLNRHFYAAVCCSLLLFEFCSCQKCSQFRLMGLTVLLYNICAAKDIVDCSAYMTVFIILNGFSAWKVFFRSPKTSRDFFFFWQRSCKKSVLKTGKY